MAEAPPKGPPGQHRALAPARVRCAVITVSDTRTPETDEGGKTVAGALEAGGHDVRRRAIVRDDVDAIRAALEAALEDADVDAAITTGGTGIARRDSTYEVVSALIEKRLDGFGELFRWLSYQEIGAAAMLSRAVAGAARGKVLAALPGSPAACRLAMEKLLVPELPHMVQQVRK